MCFFLLSSLSLLSVELNAFSFNLDVVSGVAFRLRVCTLNGLLGFSSIQLEWTECVYLFNFEKIPPDT